MSVLRSYSDVRMCLLAAFTRIDLHLYSSGEPTFITGESTLSSGETTFRRNGGSGLYHLHLLCELQHYCTDLLHLQFCHFYFQGPWCGCKYQWVYAALKNDSEEYFWHWFELCAWEWSILCTIPHQEILDAALYLGWQPVFMLLLCHCRRWTDLSLGIGWGCTLSVSLSLDALIVGVMCHGSYKFERVFEKINWITPDNSILCGTVILIFEVCQNLPKFCMQTPLSLYVIRRVLSGQCWDPWKTKNFDRLQKSRQIPYIK